MGSGSCTFFFYFLVRVLFGSWQNVGSGWVRSWWVRSGSLQSLLHTTSATNKFGERCISHGGPSARNKLPKQIDSLPAETADFSGLDKFNKSVSNMFLLNFCQAKFVRMSPCDTETYFVCFYVITCMIVLFLSLLCLTVL